MDLYLERLQQAIASATDGITSEQLTRHPQGHPRRNVDRGGSA